MNDDTATVPYMVHFLSEIFFQPLLQNIENVLCGVFRKTKLANSTQRL